MTASTSLRIVIADRQPIFRDGLKHLLMAEGGIAVVGETGDPDEAVRLVMERSADVLLLDVAMAGGFDVLARLVSAPVKTLALSASDDRTAIRDALDFVRGVVLKESRAEQLFTAIRKMAEDCKAGSLAANPPVRAHTAVTTGSHGRVLPFVSTPRELEQI
jgi:DNA-binding NarL/FixJ family response regulator